MNDEKNIPQAILFMVCKGCEYTATTPADNNLVATGNFTCPKCDVRMKAEARFERINLEDFK